MEKRQERTESFPFRFCKCKNRRIAMKSLVLEDMCVFFIISIHCICVNLLETIHMPQFYHLCIEIIDYWMHNIKREKFNLNTSIINNCKTNLIYNSLWSIRQRCCYVLRLNRNDDIIAPLLENARETRDNPPHHPAWRDIWHQKVAVDWY